MPAMAMPPVETADKVTGSIPITTSIGNT